MTYRVLIVDDEQSVTDLLAYNLRKAHYEVFIAEDGREAIEKARQNAPDLILLDLMMPEVDGLDVTRELRKTSDVPIIMITARGEELDRVVGLELGADDYVTKPFSVRELMARIKAVLRRVNTSQCENKTAKVLSGPNGLLIDLENRTACIGDADLELSRLEFDLLAHFLAAPRRVFTREQLLEQVWGYDYTGDTRSVDSAVKRLRRKLRLAGNDADLIEAVRGIGYRCGE